MLSVAAVAMIALGYPGEIANADTETAARWGWWIAGMIPFLYILYVLFGELNRSLDRQSSKVRRYVSWMRYILLVTWAVYPLAYLAPQFIDDDSTAEVVRQVGYSVADVLAKPLFGLLVVAIAITKGTNTLTTRSASAWIRGLLP